MIIFDQEIVSCYPKKYTNDTIKPIQDDVVNSSMKIFLFSDNEMQPNNEPTKIITIFIGLILFFILSLSVFCNDFKSVDVQATDISNVVSSLQHVKYILIEDFRKYTKLHSICLIPNHSAKYLSEKLANGNSPPKETLFIINTENQGCVYLQASQNISSGKVCRRITLEEIAKQLAEAVGGINLLYNRICECKNLALFPKVTSDTCKQVKLERDAKNGMCKQESGANDFSMLTIRLSNPQLFVGKTDLSSQVNYVWDGSVKSKELVKEKDSITTTKYKNLLSEGHLDYFLSESNGIIQSSQQKVIAEKVFCGCFQRLQVMMSYIYQDVILILHHCCQSPN